MTPLSFETPELLDHWLSQNHDTHTELWVKMHRKGTGIPSVTWEDVVEVVLAWGWIDGQRKSLDEVSFLQRITPRRPKSNWSRRNCEIAERLIAEGKMQPSGLVHVEAARQDGRWAQAYAGPAQMEIPEDFLHALAKNPQAQQTYETLNRSNLFAIYHRLQTARKPETRQKRMDEILARLAEGKKLL
ncbi:YdeI/OmpD-associated family protein [Deinococcus cellulosilyticus]|uniref:Uncharacterized protein n=1 Tax=Deinococcus cellulosilyticus (strain DSM 18568 / NBRC 106333 / KACC 11606 / 5516J-15) TaxID=1223518 RepID=A0A511N8D6_DEIC1|nr:YdeI/OmpD-associated family protein [Deinococcus cellulosilyticus]GEM49102.1 hypothetical protein DC3_47370 [Deinococcus cellulosilyticus NBRC 106333 = KACC 11606]